MFSGCNLGLLLGVKKKNGKCLMREEEISSPRHAAASSSLTGLGEAGGNMCLSSLEMPLIVEKQSSSHCIWLSQSTHCNLCLPLSVSFSVEILGESLWADGRKPLSLESLREKIISPQRGKQWGKLHTSLSLEILCENSGGEKPLLSGGNSSLAVVLEAAVTSLSLTLLSLLSPLTSLSANGNTLSYICEVFFPACSSHINISLHSG